MFRSTGYEVGGRNYTLDVIEHGLLRGNRRAPLALRRTLSGTDPRLGAAPVHPDPRIHFALNCGAVSCPPIRAYDAAGLDAQLDGAARGYLEAESELDREAKTLVLPGLIKLYRADFDVVGGPMAFALPLLPRAEAEWLRSNPGVRLDWSRFDWNLTGPT